MQKPQVDLILSGASQVLTCAPEWNNPTGRCSGVEIAVIGEKIAAVAPHAQLERDFDLGAAQIVDLDGKIAAPGFIDCHTHLVFGGTRALEYAARMTRSGAEVAALGIPSGIQASVAMTRASSVNELTSSALARLKSMLRCGTTTVESKSGYGLCLEKELEMLHVNRRLDQAQPVDIVSTFLGAHDFPTDVPRWRYIDMVIHEMIPQAAQEQLAVFCDVYCDDGYYSVAESRAILEMGQRFGLKPKMHVDAYANIGGCAVAADLCAVSADHLNYTTAAEIERLAEAGVVGVVMPGLDFAVRHPHPFDARQMLRQGMTLALATDLCPGCWLESMQLVMQLACRQYQFAPEEALLAATVGAARALALSDRGSLQATLLADIQVWDIPSFEDLIYRLGSNAVSMVIKRGKIVVGEEKQA
jgi:imidazolonepropionase